MDDPTGSETREGRRLYRWLGQRATLVDAVTASGAAVLTAVLYLLSAARPSGWWTAALQTALVVALAWRRTHPMPAAIGMAIICAVEVVFELQLGLGQIAVLIIIGANASRSSRPAARAVLIAGLVGITALVLRYSIAGQVGAGWVPAVFLLVSGWALVGVAWLIGDVARSRRLEREGLAETALRLEREQAINRELVAAEERRHIARELHDVVAHSLAVVVTQADGARYAAAGTPGPAVPALEAIAVTARSALDDMRGLLGVLRDGQTSATAPAQRLDDLPDLLDAVRCAGLDVRMREEGRRRPVGVGAELVLHRVVQEALTNVLKHGGSGATADVLLRWREDSIQVTVLDTGVGPSQGTYPAGHGLLGMQERLAIYGGKVMFGPRDGGGACLVADLPLKSTDV